MTAAGLWGHIKVSVVAANLASGVIQPEAEGRIP
jgi:hypothetical protein